jgi:hypothetical protein
MHLDNLRWGPVAVGGPYAQASDTETWSIKYADGSSTGQEGRWIYTLVLDSGTWKIESATSVVTPD